MMEPCENGRSRSFRYGEIAGHCKVQRKWSPQRSAHCPIHLRSVANSRHRPASVDLHALAATVLAMTFPITVGTPKAPIRGPIRLSYHANSDTIVCGRTMCKSPRPHRDAPQQPRPGPCSSTAAENKSSSFAKPSTASISARAIDAVLVLRHERKHPCQIARRR
jgi:hypothetical protein